MKLVSSREMSPQVLGRLLRIEKQFDEIEKNPLKLNLVPTAERSHASVKILKSILLVFYELGIFGEIEQVKNPAENIKAKVKESRCHVIEQIKKYSSWISNYIPVISRIDIDFVDSSTKESIYKIRSGIEFLLNDFKSIDSEFDKVLEDIQKLSSISDEFDSILRNWINSGLHYPLKEVDIPKNLPKTHWWWFEAL